MDDESEIKTKEIYYSRKPFSPKHLYGNLFLS